MRIPLTFRKNQAAAEIGENQTSLTIFSGLKVIRYAC